MSDICTSRESAVCVCLMTHKAFIHQRRKQIIAGVEEFSFSSHWQTSYQLRRISHSLTYSLTHSLGLMITHDRCVIPHGHELGEEWQVVEACNPYLIEGWQRQHSTGPQPGVWMHYQSTNQPFSDNTWFTIVHACLLHKCSEISISSGDSIGIYQIYRCTTIYMVEVFSAIVYTDLWRGYRKHIIYAYYRRYAYLQANIHTPYVIMRFVLVLTAITACSGIREETEAFTTF